LAATLNNQSDITKVWKLIPPSPLAPGLAAQAGLSLLQSQLLINRRIADKDTAVAFCSPRMTRLLDPLLLPDMDQTLALITSALENKKNITIYGDYDADGLTATALLLNFFAELGVPVSYYIPNRLYEDYGLHPAAVEKLAQAGSQLIITVDCGTSSREAITLAKQKGLQVVVTDHHKIPHDFQPLCPTVNPQRPDSVFPFKDLAGVGLAFFLAIALRAALREKGWFQNRPEPDLRTYLDLVALGTVADLVPLVGQNRILVKNGLERMPASCWPGLMALQECAEIEPTAVTAYDLAFKLGPRLNAAGRMGTAATGLMTLTAKNSFEARDLARQLNALNSQRQNIEKKIVAQIETMLSNHPDWKQRKILVLAEQGWHQGVLGVVASKIMDKYHRPTLILSIRDGVAKGSGRSIDGFDLFQALSRVEHLLQRFGGHYHAAGLTVATHHLEALTHALEEMAQEQIKPDMLLPCIQADAALDLEALTRETMQQILDLAPFGIDNPEPVFLCEAADIMDARILSDKHLKLRVRHKQAVMEAIAFGQADKYAPRGKINLVFTPEIDRYRGFETIQLRILDLEPVGSNSKLVRL
jgi:single-stranded-DNA-specific exonuclease